jgi:hypothetical protein
MCFEVWAGCLSEASQPSFLFESPNLCTTVNCKGACPPLTRDIAHRNSKDRSNNPDLRRLTAGGAVARAVRRTVEAVPDGPITVRKWRKPLGNEGHSFIPFLNGIGLQWKRCTRSLAKAQEGN